MGTHGIINSRAQNRQVTQAKFFHSFDASRSHLKNSEEPQLQGGASTGAERIGILEHRSAATTPQMGARSIFEMASKTFLAKTTSLVIITRIHNAQATHPPGERITSSR